MSSTSEPSPKDEIRECGIADALDIVGDKWSLLVLREIGFGNTRFTDIHRNTGAPRERLTARLQKLTQSGVILRKKYSERPARYEYVLSESGMALRPVLQALRSWGETYGRDHGKASGTDVA
ncbi:winged helix-turn-helix transcriptional regulator [Arthrobacter ramosus]|uniref:Winged helix-turn-helix transcriptional regulator n=1 Tax=Arthrobacter ramosus TaxID=1672 RepID=A0ABV5Y4P1_ARTRM|nr:helix-turn-helix domain-containing protein [Arthrobacter ramosus]